MGLRPAAVEAFQDEFKGIGATEAIRQTKVMSRVYGIATCGIVAEGVPPDRPLVPKQLRDLRIAFNIWDPLNTAGSLVFNQNPNALDFLKHGGHVAVAGTAYHPTRTLVVLNERPIFLAWTPAAFGFVGRSVYQRAWFPLKSYLKTLQSDDMVVTKAGVIVAKIKAAGSIVDNIMATAMRQKRDVVKEAEIGNVINIGVDEEIASINLQNLEGPSVMARSNILKNCALAGDMPAVMLNEETYVEGFGEGTEDAKRVAMFIQRVREEMNPQYEWFDQIAMHRAWSPEFYATVQKRYPKVFGKIAYTEAFYSWKNSFKATWPNFIEEPDSEKIKTEEVVLNAAIAVVQTLLPISDPYNQTKLASWLCDTLNDQETLFKTPLGHRHRGARRLPRQAATATGRGRGRGQERAARPTRPAGAGWAGQASSGRWRGSQARRRGRRFALPQAVGAEAGEDQRRQLGRQGQPSAQQAARFGRAPARSARRRQTSGARVDGWSGEALRGARVMLPEVEVEIEAFTCPYCMKPVLTCWVKGGGMVSDPDVTLIADWVYHSECWDKQVEEHPPCSGPS